MNSAYEMEFRVAYADTDRMGVVYYANYLTLFERGRTELFRSKGVRYRDLEDNDKIYLPVIEAECKYLAPARYDDLIRIRTWVDEIGGATMVFKYEVVNAETGQLLVRGRTKHPFVNKDWKPIRVPVQLKEAFKAS